MHGGAYYAGLRSYPKDTEGMADGYDYCRRISML